MATVGKFSFQLVTQINLEKTDKETSNIQGKLQSHILFFPKENTQNIEAFL